MTERAEFTESRTQNMVFGIVFLALAALFWVVLFPTGVPELNGNTAVLLAAIGGFAGFGLWSLSRLRKTGVVVVVDKDGITDTRLMPDPIPWAEVERCELVTGFKGARFLQLRLRPDAPSAARLGKSKVLVNDLVLTGRGRGLKNAIKLFAPQVPREW